MLRSGPLDAAGPVRSQPVMERDTRPAGRVVPRPAGRDARSRGYGSDAVFFSIILVNAARKSIGTGKMVVELFSVAISDSVCR
jgi:hypothetical protein